MKYKKRIHGMVLLILSAFPWLASAAEKSVALQSVAFQTHDGYFVSKQFEADIPISFVVLKDQAAFDKVFGVAAVTRDKSLRLLADAFVGQMVVAAIHRGKKVVSYQVERVAAEGRTLAVRYTTKSEPSNAAELVCPLIVSVPKGDYDAVQFIEDGKEIKKVAIQLAAQFEVTAREPGTLTTTEEGGNTVFSIKGGRGIGKATVRRVADAWPREIVVRAYLKGLEQFAVSDGRVRLAASTPSHGESGPMLHLWQGGKESVPLDAKSPYWMKIQKRNASGQSVNNLPPEDGWFEMIIPRALLKEGDSLELEWIDFYR